MTIPSEALHLKDDGGAVIFIEAPAQSIVILQALFESYEGVGTVRTMDRAKCLLSILSTEDMLQEVERILEDLKEQVHWRYFTELSEEELQRYLKEL